MPLLLPVTLFHATAGLLAGLLLATLGRRMNRASGPPPWVWIGIDAACVLPVGQVILAAALTVGFEPSGFFFLRLLAHGVFAQLPLYLALAGWTALRRGHRRAATVSWTGAVALPAIAIHAFLIEPFRLEVSRHEIVTAKLEDRVRVVLVADFQTDVLGDYERRVLETIVELDADLLLFAGDYIHAPPGPERAALLAEFNGLTRALDLGGQLAAIAVRGNCDGFDWQAAFEGTRVRPVPQDDSIAIGPMTVTALSMSRSNTIGPLPPASGFHIVLGHHPDFALGEVDADLLLAGHCHGGQVRLPLLGPPLTLSRIPRRWTEGLHEIAPDKHLCVSRGIGMERSSAPRLRFLCRPELVVIDLVPAAAVDAASR